MTVDPLYPLIMLAAVVASGLWLRRTQRSLDVAPGDRLAIGLAAFVGAMLGAKAPFVLFGDRGVLSGVFSGAAWFSNGKTILTGLVGGYLAVELVKWVLAIRTKTGDTFAAPVALAVAIGRLGCYRVGCCFGTPTELPWGVVFPAAGAEPRHPTQLYEAAFHLTMVAVLTVLRHAGVFRGQLLKFYIAAYAVYRFASETIRPEPELLAGLTAYQWASLAIVLLMAGLWRHDARRPQQPA